MLKKPNVPLFGLLLYLLLTVICHNANHKQYSDFTKEKIKVERKINTHKLGNYFRELLLKVFSINK